MSCMRMWRDTAGPHTVSVLQGVSNCIGNLSAPAALMMTAHIVEQTGKWENVFSTVAGLYVFAACAYLAFADTRRLFP